MKDYRKLKVWEKGHQLALSVYRATLGFPKTEVYGIVSQMRRAASSIPANIAEGSGRGTDGELARFPLIAMGSASELKYHLLLAKDLKYLSEPAYIELDQQADEVQKMITSLHKRVRLTAKR